MAVFSKIPADAVHKDPGLITEFYTYFQFRDHHKSCEAIPHRNRRKQKHLNFYSGLSEQLALLIL